MDEIITEDTRDIMLEFVEKLLQFAESSVNFAQEQIPDVVEQLITFYIWSYSFYMTLCVIGVVYGIVLCKNYYTNYREVENDHSKSNIFFYYNSAYYKSDSSIHPKFLGVMATFIIIFTLIICPLLLLLNMPEFIKLIVAPKVWLIEYTADLLKSTGR